MERMTAYCGLNCLECGAYVATVNNDYEQRKKVAEMWTKQFNHAFKPEDIDCDGCLSKGDKLFSHCRICEVRKCGASRNFENCGYCSEYPCGKVGFIVNNVPSAKAVLDEIHGRMA